MRFLTCPVRGNRFYSPQELKRPRLCENGPLLTSVERFWCILDIFWGMLGLVPAQFQGLRQGREGVSGVKIDPKWPKNRFPAFGIGFWGDFGKSDF